MYKGNISNVMTDNMFMQVHSLYVMMHSRVFDVRCCCDLQLTL